MEDIGIYNINEAIKLIEEYKELQSKQEITKVKILNLKERNMLKNKNKQNRLSN